MNDPTVSLVVVNYNSARFAAALLDAVGDVPLDVVVVDSNSPDDHADLEALERRHPRAKVIRLPRNVGYGAAANEGARHVTGQVLVVANADVVISGDGLRVLAGLVGDHHAALVAPRFVDPTGQLERSAHRRDIGLLSTIDSFCGPFAHLARRIAPDWHPTLYPSVVHDQELECAHVLGALMAIDAAAFRDVGGFDEAFFMYREETDLCVRVRATSGRVVHVGHVTATHVGGVSTSSRWPYQGNVNSLRSHYLYVRKHRGPWRACMHRVAGTVACLVWVVGGPSAKRPLARRALRWHIGRPVREP